MSVEKWRAYLPYDCSEAMICDFTSGVSVASLANLVNRNTMPSMCGSLCATQIAFEVLKQPFDSAILLIRSH